MYAVPDHVGWLMFYLTVLWGLIFIWLKLDQLLTVLKQEKDK